MVFFTVSFSHPPPHPPRVKDEAFLKSVSRIITIWEERNVFEMDALTRFKASLGRSHWRLLVSVDGSTIDTRDLYWAEACHESVSRILSSSQWMSSTAMCMWSSLFSLSLPVSSSLNSRRTRSESDVKHVPSTAPKAKRKERAISSDGPHSTFTMDDQPPNDRDPPDVSYITSPSIQRTSHLLSCIYHPQIRTPH